MWKQKLWTTIRLAGLDSFEVVLVALTASVNKLFTVFSVEIPALEIGVAVTRRHGQIADLKKKSKLKSQIVFILNELVKHIIFAPYFYFYSALIPNDKWQICYEYYKALLRILYL
jgi:hypothetical protein